MYKFNLNHTMYIKQTSDEEVDFKKVKMTSLNSLIINNKNSLLSILNTKAKNHYIKIWLPTA